MAMELKEIDKKGMGARIRARREALHITRKELGKYLSVTGKFISDIEYGEKGISLKNLYKLKQILGVTSDFLLEGEAVSLPDGDKKRMLSENILGSLSVCSVEQLGCMEQIARLYVEGVVNKE
ncbi:MAG: helix-turn-helix transcriptional regulator [Bacillota bacterium]|nr:helix-turn-helix transcriptional regulator [Bacillota bacterium]